jgi:hypothetical protein
MNRRNVVSILGMVLLALGSAWAQDQDNAPSSDSPPAQQPVPAYGQDNAPAAPVSENPPLSGLDLPSLQEHAAPISYLQPGATFNQTATTNIANSVGGNNFGSITRGVGTLTLRRLWSHYDLALDYKGGVAYYSQSHLGWSQLQDLGIAQKIEWKRGQLALHDNFSYLPEGNFGASYGSLGSAGISGLGGIPGGLWGGSSLGTLGFAPRIMNVSIAELTENLSPKSSFTATGGYALTHFFGNDVSSGSAFIGSSQITAQAGYNRILTPHTEIAAIYGYQNFDFSVDGTAFHSHLVEGMYGHRISGRMDLMLAAGPQITSIDSSILVCSNPSFTDPISCVLSGNQVVAQPARTTRFGVAAQARLRYRFSKSSLELTYLHYVSNGGGLFAGAQSDIARIGFDRPLSRVWILSADLGYSHNDRLQSLGVQQLGGCTGASQGSNNACPANNAATYVDGYAGAALHRNFGRTLRGFVSFQFAALSFDNGFCRAGTACNRISNRQIVNFGLDWTPRPIRID